MLQHAGNRDRRERDGGAEAARAPDPLPLMSKVPHIKAYFMFLFFLSLTPVHGPYQEKTFDTEL